MAYINEHQVNAKIPFYIIVVEDLLFLSMHLLSISLNPLGFRIC